MKKRRTSSNSSAAAGAGAGGAGRSMRKAAAPLLLLALTGLSAVPAAEGVKVIRPAQTSDQRFPPDAFAHPAFRVAWLDREPLRNATAHALLFGTPDERDGLSLLQQQQQQEHKPAMGGQHEHAHGQQHTQQQQGGQKIYSALGAPLSRPLDNESHSLELHFLDEDSPYLCAIPRINSTADKYRASPESHPTSALEVLQQALVLLDPLKSPIAAKAPSGSSSHNPASFSSNCLYHTFDWFTYAYCHGRSITQFRALPQTIGSAAELASALAESAKDGKGQTIVKRIEPRKDPQWPAFVLGRWSSDIERLLDDEGTLLLVGAQDSGTVSQHDLVSKSAQERKSAHSSSGSVSGHQQLGSIVSVSSVDPKRAHIHTALIEVVAFDDPAVQHVAAEKDKDGARFLRAAEAAAKRAAAAASRSGGSASSSDLSASSSTTNTALGKSERPPAIAQRYISQTWSDGTPCVDTGEPREIEVQYHCVPSAGLHPVDRISMVRETTVCKYVIVIETSRLCSVPALAVGRRSTTAYGVGDDAHSIDCRPIVRDDWDGDAALRDLEEERKRREEEEMAALRKRIQAQGGLTLRSPVGTAESSSSTAAAADKRGAVGGSATGKGGAGSSDSAYPGEQVGTAERRKQAEDRIVQALSDALSEYFGLDPGQTKDFLQPRDRDQEQGAESGGSHEEYYDSTGSEHAEGDVGGKGENAPADDRLDKLTDMVNRAMGDLGDAADGGGAIKLLELRVGEDGVIRSATLSAPTGAASGAAAAATATHTGTADEEAAGDDEYIDALFDELGLTDWLAGELEERAGRKDEVSSGGAIGDGSRAQRQEGGASAAGAQQVSGTAGKRKSDEEEAAAPEEEEEEEEGEEQQQQQQSRAETEQTGSSSSRAPGARQHDEL